MEERSHERENAPNQQERNKEWHKPEWIKEAYKHFHIKIFKRVSSLVANYRILEGEIIKFAELPRTNKHKN